MPLRDWTFEKLFKNAFVYNILWEDTEVDERFLGVGEDSSVLCISAAGCGVANHLSRNPRRVDAVDINPHHLALAALKASAARCLESHEELYALFGLGRHPNAERVVRRLVAPLPRWIREYWQLRWRRFENSMVQEGLTAQMLKAVRAVTRTDAEWLRRRIGETVADRQRAIEQVFGEAVQRPWIRALLNSPLQLVALGVNYSQRDRILETEQTDLPTFLVSHLKRVAETDLERNWFAWYAIAGHFNHDRSDAVPPYLRECHHRESKRATTTMSYTNGNLFDTLRRAGPDTWTHYTLCDAVDWMPDPVQKELLDEIVRTSRDGARVLYRTVEDDSLVERHGMDRHLKLDVEASRIASELDRTRQYRRVNFYTVAH
jgi:S-adenosylmethionine-diacylglycerol 3-amino-3-carboxypropyl transferase